jgi:O-glycosyl hydrolase
MQMGRFMHLESSASPVVRGYLLLFAVIFTASLLHGQEVINLDPPKQDDSSAVQSFQFVSDGPAGPGWSRPDEIARVYFKETLPAFFTRTIRIEDAIPQRGRLVWIFTGPHAGFSVELSSSRIRVLQRYYDSMGLWSGEGNFPEKIIKDSERQFQGHPRTVTVVLDSHLSLHVSINGREVLQQTCLFDVTRHQLKFVAPRTEHDVLRGALEQTGRMVTHVSVNPSESHQKILGFGGSPSIPAYAQLSDEGKARYWSLLKRYNLLIDREYPMGTELKPDLSNLEDLADATPHYYGDNFPNGEVSNFEYSRHVASIGGFVVYEMWALPPWATEPYQSTGNPIIDAWGKAVRTAAKPEEYARAVVAYCKLAKLKTGVPPAIVGIQNEVEQPPEVFDQMVLTLRRELDKAGFSSVKIHMADASFLYMGISRSERIKHNPEVWKAIDFTASHQYDYQEFFANPDLYDDRLRAMHEASDGKPFLATEICINDPQYQEASYRVAFNTAQLYHKDLTILDAAGIMYCWLLLDIEQPSFGSSRALIVADRSRGNNPVPAGYQLRVLGAFTRHILGGMKRVGVAVDNADLLVSAFEGKEGKATVVMMNRSTVPQEVSLDWQGEKWVQLEKTSPYTENETSPATSGPQIVQPGEIVVLSTFSVN